MLQFCYLKGMFKKISLKISRLSDFLNPTLNSKYMNTVLYIVYLYQTLKYKTLFTPCNKA